MPPIVKLILAMLVGTVLLSWAGAWRFQVGAFEPEPRPEQRLEITIKDVDGKCWRAGSGRHGLFTAVECPK